MTPKLYLLLFLTFIAGIFIGVILVSFSVLNIDPKVDLMGFANLILVAFLAVLIPLYITDRLGNKRCGKDLIIGEISILSEKLEAINDLLESKIDQPFLPADFTKTISLFKSVRQHFSSISDILTELDHADVSENSKILNEKIRNYWEAVTGSNGIKKNDNYILKRNFLFSQYLQYESAQSLARKLKYKVNGA